MTRTFPIRRLAAAAAAVAALGAAPAHAMLVLQSEEIFSGTGLGNVSTVLTLQGQGDATFEQGSVSYDGSADVLSGNALSGASQTMTRTIDEVGLTSAADLRIVFNAQEPGNGDNSILLTNLSLSIFSPTGDLLFNSGSLTDAPINFANTFTGTGNSGFVFALDAEQAAEAQAAGFSGDYGNNRIGLFASLSNATGGPETFFVGNAAGSVTPPIPEPETYALMLAGLGVVGFVARRRRRHG
jgi:PEP-CTERM motif